jgi:hypothetical protein
MFPLGWGGGTAIWLPPSSPRPLLLVSWAIYLMFLVFICHLFLSVPLVFLHHAAVQPIPTTTNLCCVSSGSSLVVDRFVFARSIILCLTYLVMCPAVLPSGSIHVHPTFCSRSIASALARSFLFNLPVYILILCGAFALDLDLWVIDVNNILTFGLRMMSFGLGFFALKAKK